MSLPNVGGLMFARLNRFWRGKRAIGVSDVFAESKKGAVVREKVDRGLAFAMKLDLQLHGGFVRPGEREFSIGEALEIGGAGLGEIADDSGGEQVPGGTDDDRDGARRLLCCDRARRARGDNHVDFRPHELFGKREQARAELSTAIALYRTMDMTFWLPQAEATLTQVV